MGKKRTAEVVISYHEESVIIKKVDDHKMDVIVLDYEDFEELAYKVRASPYGK